MGHPVLSLRYYMLTNDGYFLPIFLSFSNIRSSDPLIFFFRSAFDLSQSRVCLLKFSRYSDPSSASKGAQLASSTDSANRLRGLLAGLFPFAFPKNVFFGIQS